MKKIITIIAIFFCLNASAQTDSVLNSYANNVLPLKLPVKAIALYAYYFSQDFNWSKRLAPDGYKSLIGSGTKPDSLVNVTITAKDLTQFAENLLGERYGAVYNYARSIFENSPAISGYTSLISQVVSLSANGTQDQKNGANYVISHYTDYSNNLTNLINQYYNQGVYWIQH